jgi:hypothetical protein
MLYFLIRRLRKPSSGHQIFRRYLNYNPDAWHGSACRSLRKTERKYPQRLMKQEAVRHREVPEVLRLGWRLAQQAPGFSRGVP